MDFRNVSATFTTPGKFSRQQTRAQQRAKRNAQGWITALQVTDPWMAKSIRTALGNRHLTRMELEETLGISLASLGDLAPPPPTSPCQSPSASPSSTFSSPLLEPVPRPAARAMKLLHWPTPPSNVHARARISAALFPPSPMTPLRAFTPWPIHTSLCDQPTNTLAPVWFPPLVTLASPSPSAKLAWLSTIPAGARMVGISSNACSDHSYSSDPDRADEKAYACTMQQASSRRSVLVTRPDSATMKAGGNPRSRQRGTIRDERLSLPA